MTTQTATQSGFFRAYPMAIPSAGVLFFDDHGQVLVVKPRGREHWEIPGGVTHARAGESPAATARREVAEEIGLDITVGRLLGIDSVPEGPDNAPMLAFVFDGGYLSPERHASIRYVDEEIGESKFVHPDLLTDMMVDRLARRVAACAHHAHTGTHTPLYLEHGYLPTPS